jgi:hypothetical protein
VASSWDDALVGDLEAWDRRTAAQLERAYLAAGAGPGGSGSSETSEGAWRAKRQHLCVPMDGDGTWLDVGCANGHLLATWPAWCAERAISIEPYGLELLPAVAELARSLQPELADRIWTGSVMTWKPPRRFTYVTALDDQVPPGRLADLVARLLAEFVEAGGRLIVSSYSDSDGVPRPLFDDLSDAGYPPDGQIRIDRPRRHPLLSAWIDV